MNKIGFNLLAWSSGIGEDMYPVSERLKKIGYDGIECFMAEQNKEVYKQFGKHLQGTWPSPGVPLSFSLMCTCANTGAIFFMASDNFFSSMFA